MLSDEKIRLIIKAAIGHGEGRSGLADEVMSALTSANLVVVDLAELEAALKGMLNHSCVADSAPQDKDAEDHEAERKARALLAALTQEKT